MILMEAVKLYKALQEIKNEQFSVKSAHGIVMLLRDLEPHVMFFANKEKELAEKYSVADDNGQKITDGKFRISRENIGSYLVEKNELSNLEINVDVPEIVYKVKSITPSQLEAFGDYIKVDDIEV